MRARGGLVFRAVTSIARRINAVFEAFVTHFSRASSHSSSVTGACSYLGMAEELIASTTADLERPRRV